MMDVSEQADQAHDAATETGAMNPEAVMAMVIDLVDRGLPHRL